MTESCFRKNGRWRHAAGCTCRDPRDENPTESAEDVATAIAYWQERIGKRDQAREAARIDDERRERLACEAVCAKVIHDALTIWEVDDETGGRGRAIQIIVDEVQTAIREAFKHD